MDETPTRRSKIAGLPLSIREQLCQRLLDGQQGPEILPWVNALPETLAMLAARWEGDPISASNLSDWRLGGYQDWLRKRERVEKTKSLAEFCRKMGEAGGGELDLPASLAGGVMMEVMESFDGPALTLMMAEKPEHFVELVTAMAKLQSSQTAAKGVAQKDRALSQKETELKQRERAIDLKEEEIRRKTCETFLKWAADQEALKIANGKAGKTVKVDQLMLRMFGEKPTLGGVSG